ncbi:MAG: AAA family ATPase [Clostridium fessum]
MIVCISWTYGSGGVNIGFKLADKLKINFYDAEIFEAVLKRLEAQKDSIQDSVSYGIKPGIKKEPAHDQDANVNPSEAFIPERHLTLRQRMREFSRFHGLPKRDAVFFNESDLLVDMAKKEDFVILGRCGDAIMANNNIPHISIYITAPFEQRIKRAMEIDSSLTVKQARHMLKHLDHVHSQYYHYYTNRNWGHSNNYDLCINSASYGIDGTVDFIYRMIMAREEDK